MNKSAVPKVSFALIGDVQFADREPWAGRVFRESRVLLHETIRELNGKNLDFIVANDVSQADAGFGTLTNRVKIFDRDGENRAYPLMSKEKLANVILTHLAKKYLQVG